MKKREVEMNYSEEDIQAARDALKKLKREWTYHIIIFLIVACVLFAFILITLGGVELPGLLRYVPGGVYMIGSLMLIIPTFFKLIGKRMKVGDFFSPVLDSYTITTTTYSDGSKTVTDDSGTVMLINILFFVFKLLIYFVLAMIIAPLFPWITAPIKARSIRKHFGIKSFRFGTANFFIFLFLVVLYIAIFIFVITKWNVNFGFGKLNAEQTQKAVTDIKDNAYNEGYVAKYEDDKVVCVYTPNGTNYTFEITTGSDLEGIINDGYYLEPNCMYRYVSSTDSYTVDMGEGFKSLDTYYDASQVSMIENTMKDSILFNCVDFDSFISGIDKVKIFKIGISMQGQSGTVYALLMGTNTVSLTMVGEDYYLQSYASKAFAKGFELVYGEQ